MILLGQPDVDVIAQAVNGHEAVTLARRLRPDLCLLDIRKPHLEGFDATRQLAGPDIDNPLAVVVLTFDTDEHVSGALKASARGFLLKDAGPDLLVHFADAAPPTPEAGSTTRAPDRPRGRGRTDRRPGAEPTPT